MQTALKASPKYPDFRESYRDYLGDLVQCRQGQADHTKLAAIADELARFGYQTAEDTYTAESLLGRCAILAERDAARDQAKRKELARRYADDALAVLRQAVERGFKDAARMKQDADLEPLRTREGFQKMLANLEEKTKD